MGKREAEFTLERERDRAGYIESGNYDVPCVYTVIWQYPNSLLPSTLASPLKRKGSINQ